MFFARRLESPLPLFLTPPPPPPPSKLLMLLDRPSGGLVLISETITGCCDGCLITSNTVMVNTTGRAHAKHHLIDHYSCNDGFSVLPCEKQLLNFPFYLCLSLFQ